MSTSSIMTGVIVIGIILLVLGILRKVKKLILIGVIVAVIAGIVTGEIALSGTVLGNLPLLISII